MRISLSNAHTNGFMIPIDLLLRLKAIASTLYGLVKLTTPKGSGIVMYLSRYITARKAPFYFDPFLIFIGLAFILWLSFLLCFTVKWNTSHFFHINLLIM